jgi:hypothetical protein
VLRLPVVRISTEMGFFQMRMGLQIGSMAPTIRTHEFKFLESLAK